MAQGFRVLAAFSEDLGSIPSIHVAAHKSVISVLGDPIPTSGLHGYQTYMQARHPNP